MKKNQNSDSVPAPAVAAVAAPMAAQQRWGKRELEAQFRKGAFERVVLTPPKHSPVVREIHGEAAASSFKDGCAPTPMCDAAPHTLSIKSGSSPIGISAGSYQKYIDLKTWMPDQVRHDGARRCA